MSFHNFVTIAVLVLCFRHGTVGFVWEENTKDGLFESDIKLNYKQRFALEMTGNIDAEISLGRGIAKDPKKLWIGGKVPYNITEGLRNNSMAMQAIRGAFENWQSQTCIEFIERTTEPDFIEFFGTGGGCWSWVGRVGGKQRISLDKGCWQVGTVAHEIGHAMGFWHEQSRPDRDNYVKIVWDNIPQDKKHNFRKYNRTVIDSLGSAYDYISVMHYSSTAFGGGKTTIVPKDPTAFQLGQRSGLSPHDVKQADLLYKCNGATTSVTPAPPSRPPPPSGPYDCTFEQGFCGFTNIKADKNLDTFDWTLRLAGTPSGNTGPKTDHTTGKLHGVFAYIETSKPRVKGDIAILRSPMYPAFSEKCFQFYYHMLGKHMGTLNVYSTINGNLKMLWTLSGNQGKGWKLAQIQLPTFTDKFQLEFEGIRGEDYQGDIAIDDIHFLDGKCSQVA